MGLNGESLAAFKLALAVFMCNDAVNRHCCARKLISNRRKFIRFKLNAKDKQVYKARQTNRIGAAERLTAMSRQPSPIGTIHRESRRGQSCAIFS